MISLSEASQAMAQILSVKLAATSKVLSPAPSGVKGSPSAPAVKAVDNVAGPRI